MLTLSNNKVEPSKRYQLFICYSLWRLQSRMGFRMQKANYYRLSWRCKAGNILYKDITSQNSVTNKYKGYQRHGNFRYSWPMSIHTCRARLLRLGASTKSVNTLFYYQHKIMNYILLIFIKYSFRVNAPSKEHMCKSVILENTRCTHSDVSGTLCKKIDFHSWYL